MWRFRQKNAYLIRHGKHGKNVCFIMSLGYRHRSTRNDLSMMRMAAYDYTKPPAANGYLLKVQQFAHGTENRDGVPASTNDQECAPFRYYLSGHQQTTNSLPSER